LDKKKGNEMPRNIRPADEFHPAMGICRRYCWDYLRAIRIIYYRRNDERDLADEKANARNPQKVS
jgi:hypothetical protein